MLDQKILTFIAVCDYNSFTKAAKAQYITQPAVTNQIKLLEKQTGLTLFSYSNRKLSLTEEGEIFLQYAKNIHATESHLYEKIKAIKGEKRRIHFGATRTIGEFTLSNKLPQLVRNFPNDKISFHVDNTKNVLAMLNNGTILFAIVEGLFNKSEYSYQLFKMEPFIIVATSSHRYAKKTTTLNMLTSENLILREMGSGTRLILEHSLSDRNMTIDSFEKITEAGNVNIIKSLVKEGLGITFLYKDAVRKELQDGSLIEINCEDFKILREFNLVYLKDSPFIDEIEIFSKYLMAQH